MVIPALLVVAGCGGGDDRADTVSAELIAAARAQQCSRPALRAPAIPDGTALLRRLRDHASPENQCLARVATLSTELKPPCPTDDDCALPKLATLKPYPEIVGACAPLYDTIARIAHASEACSPEIADTFDASDMSVAIIALQHAVRLRIAPLVARGELAAAATHLLDALRVADDYGRGAVLMGAMESLAMITGLVATLDEILIDPRLSSDAARAIAGDLDALIATAPAIIPTMHQEAAWAAKRRKTIAKSDADADALVLAAERRTREVDRICGGTLKACVEQLGASTVDDAKDFAGYVQKFGTRDVALTFARMQAELRTVAAADCSDSRAPPRGPRALARRRSRDPRRRTRSDRVAARVATRDGPQAALDAALHRDRSVRSIRLAEGSAQHERVHAVAPLVANRVQQRAHQAETAPALGERVGRRTWLVRHRDAAIDELQLDEIGAIARDP